MSGNIKNIFLSARGEVVSDYFLKFALCEKNSIYKVRINIQRGNEEYEEGMSFQAESLEKARGAIRKKVCRKGKKE